MGWISAVGIIQHLHRRIATNSGSCPVLLAEPKLVQGLLFLPGTDRSERWWWKIHVDNFDVAELVTSALARERVAESVVLCYRSALHAISVPVTKVGRKLSLV